MSTNAVASSGIDNVSNGFTTVQYFQDPNTGQFDRSHPHSPFVLGPDGPNPGFPPPTLFSTTYADNSVDYSFSNAAVSIDLVSTPSALLKGVLPPNPSSVLQVAVAHGGYAEGDILKDVSIVTGSFFDDVLRGSNPSDYNQFIGGTQEFDFETYPGYDGGDSFEVINNPGNNELIGGNGSDVLEGRGGADILIGGSAPADFFTDFASYESSPGAVTVQLAGVGTDNQAAIATGADATGDTLVGIEALLGSRFDDILTGNSLDNILAGGLGSDTLDGKGGNDTVDYSRDHFFDRITVLSSDTADKVVVALGLNGAQGTGTEFKAHFAPGLPGGGGGVTFDQVSVDKLISIENVTGTAGSDTITGNEKDNLLDGREGDDTLDGGFGDDTLIGGAGNDTASFISHDGTTPLGEQNVISLGLNGADGVFNRSEFSRTGLQTAETDVLRGIENVTGSNRSETINGNEQNNVLDGRGGNDTLDGGLGNDTLIGGDGIDTASYVSHDGLNQIAGVVVTLGAGTADGRETSNIVGPGGVTSNETDILRGIENVTGTSLSDGDTITGNEQNNVLDGRGGNDRLDGGLGNDTLIGGDGNDTVSYASHNGVNLQGGVFIAIANGTADGIAKATIVGPGGSTTVETDILRGIENVTGSTHGDNITGNDQANVLDDGGVGGPDTLQGNKGDDTYIVNNAGDTLVEVANEGHDTVRTTLTHFTLQSNFEDLKSDGTADFTGTGNGAANFIQGNNGSDHLIGLGGDDELDGGANNDVYDYRGSFGVAFGNDRISDFSGTDAIAVDRFSDVTTSRVGNDLLLTLPGGTVRIVDHFNGDAVENIIDANGNSMVLATGLTGGGAPGIITGTDGNDVLDGKGGDDFLFGGNGNDRLIGGDGNDRLTGGKGNDTFVFAPGSGHDVVTDFSPANNPVFDALGPWFERFAINLNLAKGDQIELDGGVFHDFRQVLAASHQVGNDTVITISANDSITLQGVNIHSLHAGDFLLV
jgi:Ca2+-binding RTX toxin-like protein